MVPRARSEYAESLVVEVETSPGSDAYTVDGRLRVEDVQLAADADISSAVVSVQLDDAFDARDARDRYHPDLRLFIRTNAVEPAQATPLFVGYVSRQTAQWDGRVARDADTYCFTAEHAYGRMRRERGCQVFGRRVRSLAIERGLQDDPAGYAGQSEVVTALPCVFNAGRRPNCSAVPLTVAAPDGTAHAVHVFTYDDDPAAIPWTYATALRYLAWFHVPRPGPVDAARVFDDTDALAVGRWPADGAIAALARALAVETVALDCEGTTLADALVRLARAAGVHVVADTLVEGGVPVAALRVWAADDGPVRWLHLARGGSHADGSRRYDVAVRSVRQVLRDNDTYRATIEWDHRAIVNQVVAVGGVKRFEVTLPLVPGWLPEANLDNVPPGQRLAASLLARTPDQVADLGADADNDPWFRRYHRDGSEYPLGMNVSRRWVLNEHGRYDNASYGRNPPFHAYGPFDFSTVIDPAATGVTTWMRRPRRLDPPITRTVEGQPLPVWVEVSFDGGASWQRQAESVRILEDEIGVFLDVANPTAISPTGIDPSVDNLWRALVYQRCRVRVTGVIASDERLVHETDPQQVRSPTVHVNARIVEDARGYRFVWRTGTTDVLAGVNPDATDIEQDDRDAIGQFAERLVEAAQDRRVGAAPVIPWLAETFALGDRVGGVRGRDIGFETTVGATQRLPAVVGKRVRLGAAGYETELVLERSVT